MTATDQRSIGSISVTLAGLGCNNFGRRLDAARTKRVVDAALDAGVTLFDTADLYGEGKSEEFLGAALGTRRDEAVIVSKFGMLRPPEGKNGGDPEWARTACDASLKRLGTDRIDVYLLHRPDPDTPIVETLSALEDLRAQGKVREIGCSNFTAQQLDEATSVARENGWRGFVTLQNQYSALHREPEADVLGACERLGLSVMPYFPLASGLLTGKYRRGEPAPAGTRLGGEGGEPAEKVVDANKLSIVEELTRYAEKRGHTILELALSWLAAKPIVCTVIAGATSAEQVRANAAATTAWAMTEEDIAAIDEITGA